MKRDRGTQIQYFKLMLLTFVHLLADCTSNSLPGFLPAAMTYFGLDLAYGVVFVSTMGICCNLLQVPASKLGSRSPSSFWIKTGLLMLCSGSLMGFLPSQIPFAVICLVVMISAIGIAIVHPAGLRGVQALHHVSPGLATSVFMTGGFLGGALSPWIAGLLVERFGLKGLALFVPLTFLVTILIHVSRIRLVTESSGSDPRKKELYSPWSFFSLLIIAGVMNCGSTAFMGLVPYMLNVECGFSLSFGGFALLLFGGGSSLVSIYLGWLSVRREISRLLVFLLFCGVPFAILFFLFCGNRWAILFALLVGCLCSSAFPIMVAMSKVAAGRFSLGTRMGLMVGGTWGGAGLVFLAVGGVASRFTANEVLLIVVPGFYFLSGVIAVLTWKRGRNAVPSEAQGKE